MKRTKKLTLKTETIQSLTQEELGTVNGGALVAYNTQYCQQGGSGNIASTEEYQAIYDVNGIRIR
jgi:natural product precursor